MHTPALGTGTPARQAECWDLGLGRHSKYSQGQRMKVTVDFSDSVIFILHASIYLCRSRYSTSILYFRDECIGIVFDTRTFILYTLIYFLDFLVNANKL